MKKALIIGESNTKEYNFTSICKEKKFKPDILLVEGPFSHMNSERINSYKKFLKEYPDFNSKLFVEEDNSYTEKRGIYPQGKYEVHGLDDLGLTRLRNISTRVFLKYYNLKDSIDSKNISNDDSIKEIISQYKKVLEPIHNYSNVLLNKKIYSKNEKKIISWQRNTAQTIIKEINTCLELNDLYKVIFHNKTRVSVMFEKQMMSHIVHTRNKIFLENILGLDYKYENVAVILGKEHSNFIKRNLSRNNWELVL